LRSATADLSLKADALKYVLSTEWMRERGGWREREGRKRRDPAQINRTTEREKERERERERERNEGARGRVHARAHTYTKQDQGHTILIIV